MTTTSRQLTLPFPKDEEGKPLCRWCKGPLEGRRISWCSDKCVEDYKDRYHASWQRRQVKKRDKGICAICGLDTHAFREELKRRYWAAFPGDRYIHVTLLAKSPECLAWLEQHGMTLKDVKFSRKGMRSFWQADHTLPVVEGGGGSHWQELRTLCSACHRKETAALAKRRAQARKAEK